MESLSSMRHGKEALTMSGKISNSPVDISQRGSSPENLRTHLALPGPSHIGKLLLAGLLWWRAAKRRHLPRRAQPNSMLAAAKRSYPNGYQIEEVGPATPGTTCPLPRLTHE